MAETLRTAFFAAIPGGIMTMAVLAADRNLGTADFTDLSLWKEITEEVLISDSVSYAALASLGAKVLQTRSVELAMVHKVRTFVRSSFEDPDAPGMGDPINPPGTLICDEDEIVEQQVVTGIAYAKDEAQISLRRSVRRPPRPWPAAPVWARTRSACR